MKSVMAAILGIGFLFASIFCFAGEKPELKDQKDKESYSLGYQFGHAMKAQGVDINLEAYSSGIRDALGGTTPQLSQEEIQKTVSEVQKRVMAAQQKTLKAVAAKNLAEGKAFLEERRGKDPCERLAV
jgi:FKBP-type peptidyl-prolyl cis-trans isomerase FklB